MNILRKFSVRPKSDFDTRKSYPVLYIRHEDTTEFYGQYLGFKDDNDNLCELRTCEVTITSIEL